MKGKRLIAKILKEFKERLILEEKSSNTTEKYLRDIRVFVVFIGGNEVTKETVIAYKDKLLSENYTVRSINSMLASLNSLFSFLGWEDCRVKSIKIQQQSFCNEKKELTKEEYTRLVQTAKQDGNKRLCLILQAVCGTGIRVSELQFITVESVKQGEAVVSLKGKNARSLS